MKTLTIGQLARQAGVNLETVRFYEREGLIREPPRRPSGYRAYPPETVARLRFIRRAKELGFSLGEIADLLALRVDADTPCAEVRARAQLKLDDIASRMRSLRRMQRALSRLVRKCDERTPTGECPILEALDRRD